MNSPPDQSNLVAYIELLKRTVTNYAYLGESAPFEAFRCVNHYDTARSQWKIDSLARPATLLTKNQLDLVQGAVIEVHQRGVPGDFIEAGTWRGGVVMLMRALIGAYGMNGRKVVAADSFAGIPINTRGKDDPVDQWSDRWVATLEEVKLNIARFGLLDDKIEFLVGYFEDSLKSLADRRFAVIRLDSDSYDSVETSLVELYPRLSQGGIIIIDDWHLVGCRQAVADYRAKNGIEDEIRVFEGNGFWVKQ